MLLRTVRRAVALPQHHQRGVVLAGVVATGAIAGGLSGPARAESASGRWGWPSWLPSASPFANADDVPPIRAPARSSAGEQGRVPPPLSPSPQTSRPVFNDENLESMRLARIRQYEEGIRKLSTAEKVFAYFASSATRDGVQRMTPHDLLRAMVGSHLVGNAHDALAEDGKTLTGPAAEFVQLVDVDGDGFISWAEFLLLTSLLTIPPTQLKMAFRMFDVDNNGTIDQREFAVMMAALRTGGGCACGSRQRRGSKTDAAVAEAEARVLTPLFKQKTATSDPGRLSHDDFAGWVTALNTALVRLEFTHYASRSSHQPKNGMVAARAEDLKMTQSDFGMAVIAALVAAGRQDVAEYESRLQALRGKEQFFLELKYRKMATPNPGQANNLALINFEDFRRFQMLISYHLEEVERALTMFGKTASSGQGAGTSARFGRNEFARAVKVALRSKESLSPALLDALWAVLDKSGDGMIEYEDFFGALRTRKPRAPGIGAARIGEIFSCFKRCATQAISPRL